MFRRTISSSPKIYFTYKDEMRAYYISQEVRIPYNTPGTLYAALVWNTGDYLGAGYAGFQVDENGKKWVCFSQTDFGFNHPDFKVTKIMRRGVFSSFTGERDNRKVYARFNFENNVWYDFQLNIKHKDEDNTILTLSVINQDTGVETVVAEINYPEGYFFFTHSVGSYLADYARNDDATREMHIRLGGNIDDIDEDALDFNSWVFQQLSFEENGGKNLNGGVGEDCLFLQSGGDTKLTTENQTIFEDPNFHSEKNEDDYL